MNVYRLLESDNASDNRINKNNQKSVQDISAYVTGKKKLGVNFFFYRTRIICETIVIQDNICYKRNTLVCL